MEHSEQMKIQVEEVDVALGETEKIREGMDPLDALKEVQNDTKVEHDEGEEDVTSATLEDHEDTQPEVIGLLMQQQVEHGEQGEDQTMDTSADSQVLDNATFQSLQAIHLADGTTAYIQQLVDPKASSNEGYPPHLQAVIQNLPEMAAIAAQKEVAVEGQAVQLEDGTTAYIQNTVKDGIQAVQLEDGSTAFIATSATESFFAGGGPIEGPSLHLGSLENQIAPEQQPLIQHVQTDTGQGLQVSDHDETDEPMPSQSVSPQKVSFELGRQRLGNGKTIVIGDKAYRCQFEGCGRLYTTHHHLKVHERSHTGDRPFKCNSPGCGKAFATGYGLKSHTRVHTGEKPYKCPEDACNKGFKTSGDLQKHIRIHTGERPFKCPFEGCDKSFTTSNIRKVHIRTHTGERPYTCDYEGCGRSFASATNYKNHIRIHTGEKPYVCTVEGCGKRFTEYSSLYKHHVVHTHTKPYVCNHCSKTYRQTSTLAMHKRTAHGDDACIDVNIELFAKEEPLADDGEPPAKQVRLEVPGAVLTPQGAVLTPQEGTAPGTLVINQTLNPSNKQVTMFSADGISIDTLQHTLQQHQQPGMPRLQSILVVTDPAQLQALQAALQQQQAQLQVDGTEHTLIQLQTSNSTATCTVAGSAQTSAEIPRNTQAEGLISNSLVPNNL